jgi:hypothetical protein
VETTDDDVVESLTYYLYKVCSISLLIAGGEFNDECKDVRFSEGS